MRYIGRVDSRKITMKDGEKVILHTFYPKKDVAVRGAIQIVHGSTEHGLRYKRLAEFLCKNAYVVYAMDLRGHGITVDDVSKLGYVDWKNCTSQVLSDISEVFRLIDEEWAENTEIEKYLIGHSYGSFLVQRWIQLNDTSSLKGIILSGTSGPQTQKMFFGRMMIALVMFFTGKNRRSQFIRNLMWGSYNKEFNPDNPKGHDWLTRDTKIVEEYIEDPLSGFDPPNCFAYSLVDLMLHTYKKKNLKKTSGKLPILYIYGTDDPVGNYGELPSKTIDILKKDRKICTSLIYPKGRHEMFNELNREQVYRDVLSWMNG